MSQQPIPQTLSTFLSDLVEIRKKYDISLDDIRATTKVYPHIIAQFEEDGLNEHPLFNRLYLKAFVRSYASVVGISLDLASASYEAALAGSYNRELAVEYLGHQASDLNAIVENEEDEDLSKAEPEKETAIKVEPSRSSVEQARRQYVAPRSKKTIPKQDSWSSISSRINDQWGSLIRFGQEKGFVQWGLMAGGIGLIALVLVQVLSLPNREIPTGISQSAPPSIEASVNGEGDETSQTEEIVDSLALKEQSLITAALERVEEGDSIDIVVIAQNGKLDPFRIKVDTDLRRPYWLNEGDSMRFRVGNRVIVEDNLEAMEILLEDTPYPLYARDSTAIVDITRDSAQAFLKAQLN